MNDKLPRTPRFELLLTLAEAVSHEMGWGYVGTEHIFLALFRMKDGVGKRLLEASGANESAARLELEYWNDPTKKLREENAALREQIERLTEEKT